jgi:SAM-dependent methyltransferase
MNRNQRRIVLKQPAADLQAESLARAGQHQRRGEWGAALHQYKKILALNPDHAAACEALAQIYLTQGKLDKASQHFALLARIMPQTLSPFPAVLDTLKRLHPALATALVEPSRAMSADDFTAIANDPYLLTVLTSTVVRDHALERWLTAVRTVMLGGTMDDTADVSSARLPFFAALAQQSFINEYVFAETPEETAHVRTLVTLLTDALGRGLPIDPMRLIALAAYFPLHALPDAQALLQRQWPDAVGAVLYQQVREPQLEREFGRAMPHLTPISDGVTAEVRQQYEENPYPRWVRLAAPPEIKLILDDHLRHQFPVAPFRPTGARDTIDILIAGCGTGRNALEVAQGFHGARVLAVDLSRASLGNARRHMPPSLSETIAFAQADILALGSLDRRFDMIVVSGVLHHMADPLAGWRELIKLMKPNGLMQVGLYSAHARQGINAARKMIAERGYPSTPDGIRRCRQDLRNGPEHFDFMQWDDFFSISACRDLLFHVHEQQFTVPEIKEFLAQNGLNFVGFEFTPQDAHLHYRSVFARNGWSLSDLDRWDTFERENPKLFVAMYIFWVQKA